MSMVCSYRGVERVWEVSVPDFLLGRAGENSPPLLDLFPDVKITRLDARIWKEDGMNWIEEFQGWRGTLRNDKEIEGDGKKANPDERRNRCGRAEPAHADFGISGHACTNQLSENWREPGVYRARRRREQSGAVLHGSGQSRGADPRSA